MRGVRSHNPRGSAPSLWSHSPGGRGPPISDVESYYHRRFQATSPTSIDAGDLGPLVVGGQDLPIVLARTSPAECADLAHPHTMAPPPSLCPERGDHAPTPRLFQLEEGAIEDLAWCSF